MRECNGTVCYYILVHSERTVQFGIIILYWQNGQCSLVLYSCSTGTRQQFYVFSFYVNGEDIVSVSSFLTSASSLIRIWLAMKISFVRCYQTERSLCGRGTLTGQQRPRLIRAVLKLGREMGTGKILPLSMDFLNRSSGALLQNRNISRFSFTVENWRIKTNEHLLMKSFQTARLS